MPEQAPFDASHRRRAVYSYLRPVVEGRRVLEIGGDDPDDAEHLRAMGARAVATADHARAALERALAAGPFDVVVAPAASALVRGGGNAIASLRGLLASGGRLVMIVGNGDAGVGEGVGYYDLVDALAPHFPRVRMFGQTPFAAFGIAEFDEATGGLRVDAGMVDESGEQPTHYVAVAGPDEPLALGYALVQVPMAAAPAGHAAAADADVADLRRRLVDAEGRAEGALRVSRAQTEEIEELRARLRRAAEARADLDAEVARLRRALTEADESVLNLTRRTTEEMTALAQRMTAGLRGPVAREESPGGERTRALESALAERESALAERDDRIAALEAERQDLVWRLDEADERLRASVPMVAPAGAPPEELLAQLRAREQALDEYRRAAQAHVDEVSRLRDALMDQSTLVAELEESLEAAEVRITAAEQEAARLRRTIGDTEDADRQRRSRLAELEGTLLRMQRQAAIETERRQQQVAVAAPPVDDANARRLAARVIELEAEVQAMQMRVAEAERVRGESDHRWDDAALRIVGGDEAAPATPDPSQTEEALRARIAELEARQDSTRLATALAEVDRLRAALQRSEEQLWAARGRLLADRERIEALERAAAIAPVASAAPASDPGAVVLLGTVLDEVAALEDGLRAEAAHLAALERALAEWRAAQGGNNGGGPPLEAPPPSES